MHQKCSNYALTNLLFGLCGSMWVIDLLVIIPNPHPGTLAHPFTLKVLWARERVPTPSPFVVFTFGFAIESIMESGGVSLKTLQYPKWKACSILRTSIFKVRQITCINIILQRGMFILALHLGSILYLSKIVVVLILFIWTTWIVLSKDKLSNVSTPLETCKSWIFHMNMLGRKKEINKKTVLKVKTYMSSVHNYKLCSFKTL